MRLRSRHQADVPPAIIALPSVDPALRSTPDGDPLVEEMVERLRQNLGDLVALDPWGRPVAWRDVVRVALGGALAELRDARTAVALSTAIEDREPGPPAEAQLPAMDHPPVEQPVVPYDDRAVAGPDAPREAGDEDEAGSGLPAVRPAGLGWPGQ